MAQEGDNLTLLRSVAYLCSHPQQLGCCSQGCDQLYGLVTASDIVDKFVIVAFDVNLAPSGGKKDASYREEIKQRFTKGLAFCKSQRSAES